MPAFIGGNRKIDLIGVRKRLHIGLRREIPVAEDAIILAQVFEALAQPLGREDIAYPHAEQREQRLRLPEQFHSYKISGMQVIEPAFFNGHMDVGKDAHIIGLDQREPPSFAATLHDLDVGVEHFCLEVTLVVIGFAQFFQIVFQLLGIERLG